MVSVHNNPRLESFSTYVCPQTPDTKPGAQIHKYHAENIFELLSSHNQEFRLHYLVEIRKQGALVETVEPEPELRVRIMTQLS